MSLPVTEVSRQYDLEVVEKIVAVIRSRTKHQHPVIGIVCGSGLNEAIVKKISDQQVIPYAEIPGFGLSKAPGHKGNLILGTMGGKTVVCQQGRFHHYEGYPMMQCALPMRVMAHLGVKLVFLTNAAGALNEDYKMGDLMVIKDHICLPSLAANSPLRGPNDERLGPRFLSVYNVYDKSLNKAAKEVAISLGIGQLMREGVYVQVGGPTFETPAEMRFLRVGGGDAVGMSTAHEALVAKHGGLRIFGISVISDVVPTEDGEEISHVGVLEMVHQRAELVSEMLNKLVTEVEIS